MLSVEASTARGCFVRNERGHYIEAAAGLSACVGEGRIENTTIWHDAVHKFRFRVIEHLKGTSTAEIAVTEHSDRSYLTTEEALEAASVSLAERNTAWDTHEAILFLVDGDQAGVVGTAPSDTFRLLRSGPYLSFDYTIDKLNRVWLPAKDPPAAAGQADTPASSLLFLAGEPVPPIDAEDVARGAAAEPLTISLGELRSEIAAVDALLRAGDGTEEYSDCVRASWDHQHAVQALEWKMGTLTHSRYVSRLPSGSAEGTELYLSNRYGPKHDRILIKGVDRSLFKALTVDDDTLPDNGYKLGVATARPLPMGSYEFEHHAQHHTYIPCNFTPDAFYSIQEVTVTAPTGTLHEAFFDPVAIGTAVWADATNGVVEPAAFTVGGTATTIDTLKWESGAVTMLLSPAPSLSGYEMDVIELDGSVSLTLSVADATSNAGGTLTWDVPDRPWEAGDQLMLRLREVA